MVAIASQRAGVIAHRVILGSRRVETLRILLTKRVLARETMI
jgi:hypothetical protein